MLLWLLLCLLGGISCRELNKKTAAVRRMVVEVSGSGRTLAHAFPWWYYHAVASPQLLGIKVDVFMLISEWDEDLVEDITRDADLTGDLHQEVGRREPGRSPARSLAAIRRTLGESLRHLEVWPSNSYDLRVIIRRAHPRLFLRKGCVMRDKVCIGGIYNSVRNFDWNVTRNLIAIFKMHHLSQRRQAWGNTNDVQWDLGMRLRPDAIFIARAEFWSEIGLMLSAPITKWNATAVPFSDELDTVLSAAAEKEPYVTPVSYWFHATPTDITMIGSVRALDRWDALWSRLPSQLSLSGPGGFHVEAQFLALMQDRAFKNPNVKAPLGSSGKKMSVNGTEFTPWTTSRIEISLSRVDKIRCSGILCKEEMEGLDYQRPSKWRGRPVLHGHSVGPSRDAVYLPPAYQNHSDSRSPSDGNATNLEENMPPLGYFYTSPPPSAQTSQTQPPIALHIMVPLSAGPLFIGDLLEVSYRVTDPRICIYIYIYVDICICIMHSCVRRATHISSSRTDPHRTTSLSHTRTYTHTTPHTMLYALRRHTCCPCCINSWSCLHRTAKASTFSYTSRASTGHSRGAVWLNLFPRHPEQCTRSTSPRGSWDRASRCWVTIETVSRRKYSSLIGGLTLQVLLLT
jgi:hypothetical protein